MHLILKITSQLSKCCKDIREKLLVVPVLYIIFDIIFFCRLALRLVVFFSEVKGFVVLKVTILWCIMKMGDKTEGFSTLLQWVPCMLFLHLNHTFNNILVFHPLYRHVQLAQHPPHHDRGDPLPPWGREPIHREGPQQGHGTSHVLWCRNLAAAQDGGMPVRGQDNSEARKHCQG